MTKKFSITWTAPANDGGATITDYDIGVTPSGGSETVTSHGGTTPPHEVTGLVDGTTYGVRVRAVNSQGAGAWSSSVSQVAAVPSDAPTSLTLTPTAGGLDLSWTAPAYTGGSAISDYSVRYTPSGGSASTVLTGSTSTTHSLTGLTPGTSYDVQVAAVTAVGTGAYSSAVAATPLSTGITPNTDARARFYLPAATTSFSAGVGTSTGRFYMTDGTTTTQHNTSSYGAYQTNAYYSTYYHTTNQEQTISGMSSSVAKVVEIVSCDINGNPSGTINAIHITDNSSNIDAVDISGLGVMFAFTAFTSSAYSGNYINLNAFLSSSSQPSSITEIRAVGTTIAHPASSAYSYYSQTRYNQGGLDVSGHQLDASALDQLYTDLGDATNYSGTNALKVRGNPGVGGDSPSTATGKNYTVYGT